MFEMATRYGKKFRTRKGKYGCYKYVNGRKVAFVTGRGSSKKKYYRSKSRRY